MQNIVDCMTSVHLPSTLVKCLYLFFDLPPDDEGQVARTANEFTPKKSSSAHSNVMKSASPLQPESNFSSHEKKLLLQKVFVQVGCDVLVIVLCILLFAMNSLGLWRHLFGG